MFSATSDFQQILNNVKQSIKKPPKLENWVKGTFILNCFHLIFFNIYNLLVMHYILFTPNNCRVSPKTKAHGEGKKEAINHTCRTTRWKIKPWMVSTGKQCTTILGKNRATLWIAKKSAQTQAMLFEFCTNDKADRFI